MAQRVVTDAPAPAGAAVLERWRALPWWGRALAIFAASRIVTTLLFVWVAAQATAQSRVGANPSLVSLMAGWDGQWYWRVAEAGYPTTLPIASDGGVDTNAWAFLPVYPFLAKILAFGDAGPHWQNAAELLSVAFGFATAVVLALLLRPHIGGRRADFAVAVFAFSPLAFLLQMAYAESMGLFLTVAILCLVDRGRFLAAVPLAILLAFTRPGVLAVGLLVGVLLVLRIIRSVRSRETLEVGVLVRGAVLVAVCVAAGFAWSAIAGFVTGVPDAYFETEMAWRALWMGRTSFQLFTPWLFAADYWFDGQLHWGPAAAVVVLLLIVGGFAALLFTRPVTRLGTTNRVWLASWALYLLAVFFPQSSIFRLLMPMAPLAGALTPRSIPARAAVLVLAVALQALWLWVVLGPFQTYWSVP